MTFIIRNKTKKPIDLAGVSLPAGIPLKVETVTDAILSPAATGLTESTPGHALVYEQ